MAVIGLGAMGSMALWRLAERGATVVGFDRFDPPHTLGSSHGETRIFRLSAHEGLFYMPIAQRASMLWKELGEHGGDALLTQTGLLQSTPLHDSTAAVIREGFRVHDLPFEELTGAEASERFPAHRFDADDRCFVDPNGGFLRPELAISRALDAALSTGRATIHPCAPVDGVRAGAGAVEVTANGEVHRVRHVVNATGGWVGDLVPGLGRRVRVQRQVQVWMELDEPGLFVPDRFPVFIRHLRDGQARYGFPSLDGRTAKMATHHDGMHSIHPDDIDRSLHEDDTLSIQAFVADHLRGVTATVVRTAICFYANAADGHFIVGTLPASPWLTIIGACSGHGFKFAAGLGDIAADLALDGTTAADISEFSPVRLLG